MQAICDIFVDFFRIMPYFVSSNSIFYWHIASPAFSAGLVFYALNDCSALSVLSCSVARFAAMAAISANFSGLVVTACRKEHSSFSSASLRGRSATLCLKQRILRWSS